MKVFATLAMAAVLSAAFFTGSAAAQGRIYAWCLEQSCGFSGSCQTLCRFDTYQQCRASWSPGDRCVQNFYKQRP